MTARSQTQPVEKKEKTGRASKELSKEDKIAAFLKAGGKIQQIPIGVSGQEKTKGPRHITLGNKPKNQNGA
ncbi:MAG: hypothetical protein OEZ23_02120 [Gammaproteobacteria bacterium]|nr:hypothetical protein [Gammaproteobacteria bacterium]